MEKPKPKKIFYLINSLHKGGAERQLLTISPSIGGVILLLEDEIHYETLPDMEIHVFNKNKTYGSISKIYGAIRSAFMLIRMIRREMKVNDVIVLSFLERSNIINLFSSLFTGHKSILSIRINLSIQYKEYPILQWGFKKFYKKAFAITSNSAGVCGQMVGAYDVPVKKVFHVPNCYDVENILRLSSKPLASIELESLIQTRDYFVCINRLDHQKKIGFQIELIATLKETHPGICLIVVGDGPQRSNLISKAENIGLSVFSQWAHSAGDSMQSADIIFLGHTHNPYRLCAFSKALLLTSNFESLPNVVIEALICKTVVLAADCNFGPREILSSIPNYSDPNRKYGKMDCGILLPLIENNQQSLPIWLEYSSKILRKEIVFQEFEAESVEKIKEYALPSIINKWESLLT
jgi:N-acetylgalactosamine-N,N'-diacetylbacillosaminyl-diphospho-undecaprenol 4-alpha-N-acetylgalactosaminyltransferase